MRQPKVKMTNATDNLIICQNIIVIINNMFNGLASEPRQVFAVEIQQFSF